jgi:hypothetical protein
MRGGEAGAGVVMNTFGARGGAAATKGRRNRDGKNEESEIAKNKKIGNGL